MTRTSEVENSIAIVVALYYFLASLFCTLIVSVDARESELIDLTHCPVEDESTIFSHGKMGWPTGMYGYVTHSLVWMPCRSDHGASIPLGRMEACSTNSPRPLAIDVGNVLLLPGTEHCQRCLGLLIRFPHDCSIYKHLLACQPRQDLGGARVLLGPERCRPTPHLMSALTGHIRTSALILAPVLLDRSTLPAHLAGYLFPSLPVGSRSHLRSRCPVHPSFSCLLCVAV